MTRKIIQCWGETQNDGDSIYATTYCLCDDGTIWRWEYDTKQHKHRWYFCDKMSQPPGDESGK